jgi:AraC-like DNA-binding protein
MGEWDGELSPHTSLLAASDDLPLLLGHFRCPPDDPAWAEVNHIGRLSLVVFPRTAVTISPERAGPLTADANRVVLYDPGQRYRRGLLDPRGDDCLFVGLGPDLLARVAGAAVESDGTALRFVGRHRSCPADVWRAVHRVRSLVAAPVQDELAIEESLLGLVEDVFAAAGDRPGAAPSRGAVPMSEATRAVLADRYREDLTLGDVATEVGVSKYHLHRTFRAATGWTIHAYRDHLRLREGLARVLDGEPDLSMLAFDLGFSSHSHFTDRFRRAFGATPSQVRRDGAVSSRR